MVPTTEKSKHAHKQTSNLLFYLVLHEISGYRSIIILLITITILLGSVVMIAERLLTHKHTDTTTNKTASIYISDVGEQQPQPQ